MTILEILANAAQVLAGIGAVVALFISVKALRESSRIKQSENLIDLRRLFNESGRDEVHEWIRNGNKIQKWHLLDDYLGIFELCEVLIQQGNLNENAFQDQYGYRLSNILSRYDLLQHKLIAEHSYWKRLYDLVDRMYPHIGIERLQQFAAKTMPEIIKDGVDLGDSDQLAAALVQSPHGDVDEIINSIREKL